MNKIKVYINGKLKAEVKNNKLVFLKGNYDLNPYLEATIPHLQDEERDGIIFSYQAKPPLWKKLFHLDNLGFDINDL